MVRGNAASIFVCVRVRFDTVMSIQWILAGLQMSKVDVTIRIKI